MTNPRFLIAIHGGSGTQGSAIVRKALEVGFAVRAVTRGGTAVRGAEVAAADLADQESLVAAYSGVQAVVVSMPLVFDPVVVRHQADTVLSALESASVERAVLLTNGPLAAERTGNAFVDARARLADGLRSAVPKAHVVAVSGIYMQNLTAAWSLPVLEKGAVAYPLPSEAPVPWLDMNDVADGVLHPLVAGKPTDAAMIGPEALTGEVVANLLSRHFGPVVWRAVSTGEYTEMLRPHLGLEAAEGIADLYASPPYATRDLPLRAGPTTLADYLVRGWGR